LLVCDFSLKIQMFFFNRYINRIDYSYKPLGVFFLFKIYLFYIFHLYLFIELISIFTVTLLIFYRCFHHHLFFLHYHFLCFGPYYHTNYLELLSYFYYSFIHWNSLPVHRRVHSLHFIMTLQQETTLVIFRSNKLKEMCVTKVKHKWL
jgi:hypothetical protein